MGASHVADAAPGNAVMIGEPPTTLHASRRVTATNTRSALPAGTALSCYRVLRLIGSGGFSLIYLGEDEDTFDEVAIKEYLPKKFGRRREDLMVEATGSDQQLHFDRGLRLFYQEVRTLATLRHPSIVNVRQCFLAYGTAYLVMDYEPGTSLAHFIQNRGGELSVRFMLTVFPPLLDALDLIHSHRHLHLDIKPSNIRLRPGGRPLLLDFGSANKFSFSEATEKAKLITPGYSPPEQYHSMGDVGPWTDVYAVGATMRTCLDGRPPPSSLERITQDRLPPAVTAYEGRYPDWLLRGIDWAMGVQVKDRPQGAGDLRDYLLDQAARAGLAAPDSQALDPRAR